MKNEKITIFLSHSHKDFEKVRKIRDILETLDCEPLIFYLKCLDDSNAELEQFIKKEIEARNIFIYCKSQNAENSAWVQKELEYIKSFDSKRLYTIDIENGFSRSLIYFLQTLTDILVKNRAYISHAPCDQDIFNRLADRLELNGYQILNIERSDNPGADFAEYVPGAIADTMGEGIFIALFSANTAESRGYINEIHAAFTAMSQKKGKILVLAVDDGNGIPEMPDVYRYFLGRNYVHVISRNPTDAELDALLNRLIEIANRRWF